MIRTASVLLVLASGLAGCGSETSATGTESALGVLVECDQVIEERFPTSSGGYLVRRQKVASVPSANPASVTITRCDEYYTWDGGPRQYWAWPEAGADCYVAGSWVVDRGVTFTPNFDVYVECEEEETFPSGPISTAGNERVYVRTEPLRTAARESPLGFEVECDEVVVEPGDGSSVLERRHEIAHVPVDDPAFAKVTRCGAYHRVNETTYASGSLGDCVTLLNTELTSDLEVVVECGTETLRSDGTVSFSGFEHVYVDAEPRGAAPPSESSLGTLIECDEVLERDRSLEDPPYDTVDRLDVAYVPVADPASVAITRCGEYRSHGPSSDPDTCEVTRRVEFTPDFEVFVACHHELTRSSGVSTSGYERTYIRAD